MTVTAGNPAALSVAATGTGLTYQWYQGSTGNTNAPITGATTANYPTPPLASDTDYWVLVKNASGLVDSATARIITQPIIGPATLQLNLISGLTIDGTAGGAYRVEYTTNLTAPNWLVLTNAVFPVARNYFADWDSTNSVRRFYRVVSP